MQLAQILKSVGISVFPCVINYNYSKKKYEKHPMTPNRESWMETAKRPLDDPAVNWQGVTVIGIPIPLDITILDGDHHKPGCTTDDFDRRLGCKLDWDKARVQNTVSGGSHYAFRTPKGWKVRQGSNILGKDSGLDSRTTGKGFICSGEGYTPTGVMGVAAMAYPELLPELPDECRHLLEEVEHEAPATPAPLPQDDDRDTDTIITALRHIDPSERDTWRNVGFALKHHYHDDQPSGFSIFDAWSAGSYTESKEVPTGYDQSSQGKQWESFRVVKEGATITIGSLFHMAMKGGWTPPAKFDTSTAFGEGAASADEMNVLVQRIMEEGADSRHTEDITKAIAASGCNELQALLLRNELKAALKGAKLLDKDLSAAIDKKLTPQRHKTVASGEYNKSHTQNARLFLSTNYPEGTLLRSDQTWYAYDGRSWVEYHDDSMRHMLSTAMEPSLPQVSTTSGTLVALQDMTYVSNLDMRSCPSNIIIFQNGVLDLSVGQLLSHDKRYMTTNILPYAYNPAATAPSWVTFVNEIFEGDQERIMLLQEWLGYMMMSSNKYQKVMLFIGPKRAGKSTIGDVLALLVGEGNYCGSSLSSFASDSFVNSMRHKTVAFSGDTEKHIGKAIADTVVARIKKISGGDYIDFDRKYKDFASCKIPARLSFSANHIPRMFDDSDALASRLLILPFERSFYGKEDTTLGDRLATEIEGIAMWALQGLHRLENNLKFTLPEASKDEIQFISEAFNPLRTFIDTVCTLGGDTFMTPGDLHDAYRRYALGQGEDRIMGRKVFVNAFKDASRGHGCKYGVHRTPQGPIRGFKGVECSVAQVESSTASAFSPQVVGS